MISVSEALDRLFSLAAPLGTEEVPLLEANGRILARDVTARRDQPPFDNSAMDGYAVTEGAQGDSFRVIGESAAGHRFTGPLAPGEAVRIFTGAPIPEGTGRVILQEDVTREGDTITITGAPGEGLHIRQSGDDFRTGDSVTAPRRLSPNDIALMAAMNIARVPVARQPRVAIIATGDELVMPGEDPGPDQIVASNSFGLRALLSELGATPRLLPIARDSLSSLRTVLELADDSDLVLTIGGASVGDHDLVAQAAADMGLDRAFHKVAMRPGKPLMSGRLGDAMMIGLPGNPVSAMVCGHVFVAPVIRAMLGLGASPAPRKTAHLARDIPANGPREHYMRARRMADGLSLFDRQDSSLLSILSAADALIVRPPHDPARSVGENVDYLPLS
ncbi:molybdopterin molybdotransferase MoeA [Allosediminivita pacifica]|uniref:Molybdopterin molybdenumtransferase n=1 Tax=Allosediminivita pacifica TaxID=1267769 RepID=A0A2T6B2I4_9RHOB|nr:gephyrin-like molybdotransferase Glp [Allosediminivita pacifica]PTX50274.1 molybdopterin molybdotransferase [Allosediminivita pacifica]GGB02823.1 molybdopterin molybdenumtransferase MoeA [Allosediminivita pacifica]